MMKNTITLLIILLILFHVGNNLYMLYHHRTPQMIHAAWDLFESLQMYDEFSGGNLIVSFAYKNDYGPAYSLLTQPFLFLFGRSVSSALLVNSALFSALIVGTFLIGKQLFSEGTGLLAAFILSFYPPIYGLSRVYSREFAVVTALCFSFYYLIKAGNFSDRRRSLIFGVTLGLTALFKPVVFLYLGGPLIVTTVSILKSEKKRRARHVRNLLLALVVGLALYSLWFLQNPSDIVGYLSRAISMRTIVTDEQFTRTLLLNYPMIIWKYELLPFFTILFLVALVSLLHSSRGVIKWGLTSYILLPLLFFTLIGYSEDPRFLLPLTIGFSLITSAYVTSLRSPILRKMLICLCIGIALLQFTALSFECKIFNDKDHGLFLEKYFSDFFQYPEMKYLTETWKRGLFRPSVNTLSLEVVSRVILEDARVQNTSAFSVMPLQDDLSTPLSYLLRLEDKELDYFIAEKGSPLQTQTPTYVLIFAKSADMAESIESSFERNILAWFKQVKGSYDLLAAIPVYPTLRLCPGSTDVELPPGRYNATLEIYRERR